MSDETPRELTEQEIQTIERGMTLMGGTPTLVSAREFTALLHMARRARAAKYDELIYAVETKYPNESRHETALRYIRERENPPASEEAEANARTLRAQIAALPDPGMYAAVLAAANARAKDIDRMNEELLTLRAEVQRLATSLREVKAHKDQRIVELVQKLEMSRDAMAARLTDEGLNKAMHAHDFAQPESSGFDEMRAVLLDWLTGAGEETT